MLQLQKGKQAFSGFCGVSYSLIVKTILYTIFGTSLSDVDVSLTMKKSIFQSLNTDKGF